MEAEVKEEKQKEEWERKVEEMKRMDEERTKKNQEKRAKAKARKGKGGKNGGTGEEGSKANVQMKVAPPVGRVDATDPEEQQRQGAPRIDARGNAITNPEEIGVIIHDDD